MSAKRLRSTCWMPRAVDSTTWIAGRPRINGHWPRGIREGPKFLERHRSRARLRRRRLYRVLALPVRRIGWLTLFPIIGNHDHLTIRDANEFPKILQIADHCSPHRRPFKRFTSRLSFLDGLLRVAYQATSDLPGLTHQHQPLYAAVGSLEESALGSRASPRRGDRQRTVQLILRETEFVQLSLA